MPSIWPMTKWPPSFAANSQCCFVVDKPSSGSYQKLCAVRVSRRQKGDKSWAILPITVRQISSTFTLIDRILQEIMTAINASNLLGRRLPAVVESFLRWINRKHSLSQKYEFTAYCLPRTESNYFRNCHSDFNKSYNHNKAYLGVGLISYLHLYLPLYLSLVLDWVQLINFIKLGMWQSWSCPSLSLYPFSQNYPPFSWL